MPLTLQRQPATTESDGCTNSETRCLYLSDATALIPRSEFLSRFVGLRGIYGESSMLTEAPRIYDLPDNPNEAGGAGSVVQVRARHVQGKRAASSCRAQPHK